MYLGVEEALEGHAGLEGAFPRAVALALGGGRVVLEGAFAIGSHGIEGDETRSALHQFPKCLDEASRLLTIRLPRRQSQRLAATRRRRGGSGSGGGNGKIAAL